MIRDRKFSNAAFLTLSFLLLSLSLGQAQLRRPGFIEINREDRSKKVLNPEKGAVYLQGLVTQPVTVSVPKTTPAYYKLTGNRWLGDIRGNQKAVLLAVSPKAYRIRAQAAQGQVAGWVRKDAVTGVPDGFEQKLTLFHQRYQVVKQLIDNKQVALGMTTEEVAQSIGPPDSKTSLLEQKIRKDTFLYISYTRTPQTIIAYDQFGAPFTATQYIEVESGRVTIEFTDNLVSSIAETEGINLNSGKPASKVPAYIHLF